jgi:hypothetical protein
MQHVQMCAGGDLMEKTLTEAAQLLQKISKAGVHAKRLGNKTCGRAETQFKDEDVCWNFKRGNPGITKEEPIPEKLEEEHIKSRTTPSVVFAESNEKTRGVCQARSH